MVRSSRISTSSAQVDGQSCGQAEWPILIFEIGACWFISPFYSKPLLTETNFYRKIIAVTK
ncbi:hypothetical protein C3731_00340 [Brucella oryzae]|uniref:Uncharacterized protein n=1 Tax=Brucella oryzae TaxID=335286 RepID=A0A2S7J626_9HYPH|nr:hypothetical protein C3731_00340 [Brucella oryzae]